MTISKHLNHKYSGGFPLNCGDRYYSQDLGRDFNYLQDRLGLILKDLSLQSKLIVSGGVVSQVSGQDKIDITALIGYVPYSTTIPNVWTSIPPTTTTSDINLTRVVSSAITNFDISTTATLNGSTPNYVKMSYNDEDLTLRQRAKKAGTYYCEVLPSYILTCDSVAPTAYELCLATIVSAGSGAAMTITTTSRTANMNLSITGNMAGSNLTLGNKFTATANTATIASGAITYTGMNMIIDTEGAAASDDLTIINGMVAGQFLVLHIANAARNVVIKNSASLVTSTSEDVTLDLISDCIIFYHNGAGISEVARGVKGVYGNSLAANGYLKIPRYPNDPTPAIMQWGTTALNTDTVSFPLTFPSTLLSLNIVAHGNIGTAPIGNLYSKNTSSTSGFTTYAKDVAVYLIWYAIGY